MEDPLHLETLFPDRRSTEPLATQLTRRLRAAIEAGVFPPGTRLLSSRELARRLGLGRNTVTDALDQLVAEGYLETRSGAGTFVSGGVARIPNRTRSTKEPPLRVQRLARFEDVLSPFSRNSGPLRVGEPDKRCFPNHAWRTIARKDALPLLGSLGYAEPSGVAALRRAIAVHVRQFRGVSADPDCVIVVEGAQEAFRLAALLLTEPGDAIAIEDPCYSLARALFEAEGLALRPVPVDDEGLNPSLLPAGAKLAYITPSHQFPLGGSLTLSRRLDVLEWAKSSGAYILEDDYDSEFSFESRPLPALQSLDRDERVIYVGTFSKTLAPSLRLGYMIVPPHLARAFNLLRALTRLGTAGTQATLAAFISQGHFARHIRRMTAIYDERRIALIDALSNLPRGFRLGPAQNGLHIALIGPPDFDDRDVAFNMQDGQRLVPLSSLSVSATHVRGFILGYCAEGVASITKAAQTLRDRL